MKKSIVISSIAIILGLIAIFPYLASTPLGKPLFVFLLERHLKGDIQIQTVHASWLGPQRFENTTFQGRGIEAQVPYFSSPVPFWSLSKMGDSFEIQKANFFFPDYGGGRLTHVQARIEGKSIFAAGSTPEGGSLAIQGKIESKENFDLTADLFQIPTIAIDRLLKQNGLLYKCLGPFMSLKGSLTFLQNRGDLSLDLNSPNAKGFVSAAIANNMMTLKEPLTASLILSDELKLELLKHISPTVISDLQAQNPFTLKISQENFSCPINPFAFEKLQVESALLDLGQVRARLGKDLESLLKFIKLKNPLDIWFTSVQMQIQDSNLSLGRIDALLSHSVHLCAWGDIDVENDSLKMFLGLPADTLEKLFGISTLSRNYVLKIPIRGSIKHPDIETGPAVAKIATMSATKQIPTKGGKIFGGILNTVIQAQDDGDAPPPNRPFPWEK